MKRDIKATIRCMSRCNFHTTLFYDISQYTDNVDSVVVVAVGVAVVVEMYRD